MCSQLFYQESEMEGTSVLDGMGSVSVGDLCFLKDDLESMAEDSSSDYATGLTSPVSSLTSYKSCLSSLGDLLNDVNLQSWDGGSEGAPDTYQDHCDQQFSEDRESENIHDQTCQVENEFERFDFPKHVEEIDKLGSETVQQEEREAVKFAQPLNIETDPRIWIVPEPEDEDDTKISMDINNNHVTIENESTESMQCSQPSSFDDSAEKSHCCHRIREKHQKALTEVMNGRFCGLVRQLLAWAGVSLFEESGESWLDLVTSLSWEAAMLVKPENAKGKSMDPGNYVKVKCIESGSRSQSQVINGLVFKKNAAHKNMPTKYVNPTLLLLQGGIEPQAKKDYLKSIINMIERSCPDVIVVEKSVSLDAQESILQKGITLISDMKFHRLEKIACCTDSQIVPTAGDLVNLELKKCGLFHIEKVVEEHGTQGEGGKCLKKTLMFFEDFPRPLGCTILLKGAHNDELKRVKCVVQHAVPRAYHMIQEISFLVDQRAIFASNRLTDGCLRDKQLSFASSTNPLYANQCSATGFAVGMASSVRVGIPTSDELLGIPGADLSTSPHSIFKRKLDYPGLMTPDLTETFIHDVKGRSRTDLEVGQQHELGAEKAKTCSSDIDKEVQMTQDGLQVVLDTQWILVLLTSRCVLKGTVCKQNRLSRVKFYKDSDISFGGFLHNILLNQKQQCSKCGEMPNVHSYSYSYHNGKLMILVKQLPPSLLLPGKEKGILWMWTLCLKCNCSNGIPKHTRRVMMSNGARRLSFGKFLELCISENSAISRLSTCGHLLFRDCLQFYGLGSAVAMFSYSPISVYMAVGPPPVLEFCNPNGQGWLQNEAEQVLDKGNLLFMEVANSLQKMRSEVTGMTRKQTVKNFSEVEEMLMKEKSDFEVSLQKAITKNGLLGQTERQILYLNRLNHELLLELYVWDRRLQSLQLSMIDGNATERRDALEPKDRTQEDSLSLAPVANSDEAHLSLTGQNNSRSACSVEKEMDIKVEDASISCGNLPQDAQLSSSPSEIFPKSGLAEDEIHNYVQGPTAEPSLPNLLSSNPMAVKENHKYTPTSDNFEVSHEIPVSTGSTDANNLADSNFKFEEEVNCSALGDNSAKPPGNELHPRMVIPLERLPSNLEDNERWIWAPFSETCKAYRKDIQSGHLQKFDFVNKYTPSYLFMANQLISEERSRLFFPVDADDNVVSIYEDELSSVVAYAVALLQDQFCSAENVTEKERNCDKGGDGISTYDGHHLFSNGDAASSYRSSTVSSNVEGIPSREVTELGSEGFFSVDSLLFARTLHPAVHLGIGKVHGRGKYSVICFYAKNFYNLRKRCCPSELDYISSICRSKKWNAQGGKSGALFSKTLDDRFIVKQIKGTELNSFVQFGPNYFKHISWCLDSSSQTCLAKILGIYQVIIRQSKNGKDVVVNLMVMENIFFGRNISRVYDLKGVVHSRYSSNANATLLDQNFVEDVLASPYFVGEKTKQRLQRAIWNDTSFLTSINVMDYSLLLGVDKAHGQLAFGIIDYLRQYTWDKHLETWVKASLVVPKNELPTVVSPKEYKKRFRKFVSTYLFTTPVSWCSYQILGPFEYCANCSGSSLFYNLGKTENASKQHFFSL